MNNDTVEEVLVEFRGSPVLAEFPFSIQPVRFYTGLLIARFAIGKLDELRQVRIFISDAYLTIDSRRNMGSATVFWRSLNRHQRQIACDNRKNFAEKYSPRHSTLIARFKQAEQTIENDHCHLCQKRDREARRLLKLPGICKKIRKLN